MPSVTTRVLPPRKELGKELAAQGKAPTTENSAEEEARERGVPGFSPSPSLILTVPPSGWTYLVAMKQSNLENIVSEEQQGINWNSNNKICHKYYWAKEPRKQFQKNSRNLPEFK